MILINRRSTPFFVLCLLIVIGWISYYPSFKAPFVFDDLRVIVKNRQIHVDELSWEALSSVAKKNRPVAHLSFALNYYFGKLNVFGYHLVNLIIHIITAFAIYLFLHTTLTLPFLEHKYKDSAQAVALAVSLLFVAHPVNTQSITYVVQRMNALATLFFFLSMLFYVKGRLQKQSRRMFLYVVSLASAVLALKSKENAATLPVFIALYEIYFFQGLDLVRIKKVMGHLLALVVLPLIVASRYLGHIMTKLDVMRKVQFTLGERLLTELRVLMHYISLLFLPHPSRLNLDYDFSVSRSLFNPPTTFLSFLGFLGLLFLGFYLAKRRPLVSFGIAWFLGNLVIESTVIPLELIYEHRLYLPSMGFFLVLVCLCWDGFDALKFSGLLRQRVGIAALVLSVSICSFWTYRRNLVWQDSFTLWADVVKKSPGSGRAHDNLALTYFRTGQYDKAIAEHLAGIKLGGPALHKKLNNLGNAYFKTKQFDKAVEAYENALKIDPNFVEARNGLGVAYNSKGLYAQAAEELQKVIQLDPRHPGAHSNLGLVYSNQGLYEKAAQAYQRDLEINPGNVISHNGLGRNYAKQGLYEKAIAEYKKAISLNLRKPSVYNSLGSAYAERKMYGEAEKAFLQALALDSNYFPARKHLGNIYYLLKVNDKAIEEWQKALALNPQDKVLRKNLEIVRRQDKTLSNNQVK